MVRRNRNVPLRHFRHNQKLNYFFFGRSFAFDWCLECGCCRLYFIVLPICKFDKYWLVSVRRTHSASETPFNSHYIFRLYVCVCEVWLNQHWQKQMFSLKHFVTHSIWIANSLFFTVFTCAAAKITNSISVGSTSIDTINKYDALIQTMFRGYHRCGW